MRLACPVCQARFRGLAECGRCGAGLLGLQSCVVVALRLRGQARRELSRDPHRARLWAARAESLHSTPAGRALVAIASALGATPRAGAGAARS